MNNNSSAPKKKRGRKPKGGKIINKELTITQDFEYKPNIIVHLKCDSKSIRQSNKNNFEYDPNINTIIPSNTYDNAYTNMDNINNIIFNTEEFNKEKPQLISVNSCQQPYKNEQYIHGLSLTDYKDIINNINKQFSSNSIIKSDCFRCCHPYDTPSIYIPKNRINSKLNVYGCFCSVECACGFLFDEKINMSKKFERYTLLVHTYKDIIKDNHITPSPSPYYLLSKFCGTMEIDEYRNIYTTNHTINCINKPNSLNIEYPELYLQINDHTSVYNYDAKAGSGFKIKKSSNKKKDVINSYFNL